MMVFKSTPSKLNLLMVLAIAAAFFAAISTFAADSDQYRATGSENLLQVHTPEGTRVFFGDSAFGDLSSYRVEIPLGEMSSNSNGGSGSGSGNNRTPGPSMNDDLDQLFAHANDLYVKGKFAASQEYVDEILRRDPKNSRALVMKGSLYHAQGNKEQAKETWRKALEVDPKNKTIQNILENYK